jgi:uncharacterized protein YggE
MKRLMLGVVAALAMTGASSASAQTPGPGEMTLHIETLGIAKPDMATVTLTARVTGKDEKEARAKLAGVAAAIRAKLAKAGIAASAIKDGEVDVSATPDYAAQRESIDAAASAAAAAADAASVGNDGAMAHDAAMDMPMLQAASMPITVTVADLAKLEAVLAAGVDETGETPKPHTLYSTRDPQAAHARAVQDALTKARTEADGYAAALGYRVVRVIGVSSAKPKANWPDLMGLASGFDGPGNSAEQEMLRLVSSTYAGAQIDYAIAPK